MRKLVACLACRNGGSRLFGKPLQNLDVEKNLSILDYMIEGIKGYKSVSSIVLAISEGVENEIFISIAKRHSLDWIIGSSEDVLSRLIAACELVNGTDIFRVTTESPFTYFDAVDESWKSHIQNDMDLTALDDVPDGCGFEIIKLNSYKNAWYLGGRRHRSEYCSLYIRENSNLFKIAYVRPDRKIMRTDIRLTVDYPEDLALARKVYEKFRDKAPYIPVNQIIEFLDEQPDLMRSVAQYVPGGLQTMYIKDS